MKIGGVDFPEPLLNALRDRRLVVFAGAGVSIGPPANLPDFRGLALQVAEGTGLSIVEYEPEDRFLGRVKAAGPSVHQIAAQRLQRNDPQPTELHRSLLRLYPGTEDVRIVTTNFDLLFEEAANSLFDTKPKISHAPALPLGQRFQGIVHIHGSVSEPEETVLTNLDFGRAYLTEADGWGRRFLVDLFANHTVLFVGYSHNDTIMTYLTPSLLGDSNDMRYALIGDRSDTPARWRSMGIQPITFPQSSENDYSGLDKAVAGLANYTRRGILDWQREITAIASAPPPIDEESTGIIEHALGTSELTQFFTKSAISPDWIEWLDRRHHLAALFTDSKLSEQEGMLASWLSRCFALHHRTIAKSGNTSAEAGDGLHWSEGAAFGSQGHGHPGGKPSFQAQGVQPGVDQGGEYFPQPRTPQRVDVLIPTAVFHVMQAVLNAPVVAEHSKQFLRSAPPGTQAGQQIPALPAHLPGGYIHGPLLHHCPLPRPGKSQFLPDIISQFGISPNPAPFDHPGFFSTVSACGSPSSSAVNPSARAASTAGWFPLTRTR